MQLKRLFVLIPLFIFLDEQQKFIQAEPLVGQNVTDALENQYPFLVSIGVQHGTCDAAKRHKCTGTLISRWLVLTAAHCVANQRTLNIVVGSVDLLQANTSISSEKWINYDQWAYENSKTRQFTINDIAVIKLETEVIDETIEPAFVWDRKNEDLFNRDAVLVGWDVTHVLQVGDVKIISNDECAKYRQRYQGVQRWVLEQYICSNAKPYVLLGPGDCGGPIIIEKNVIAGVNTVPCEMTDEMREEIPRKYEDYQVNLHASVPYYKEFIDWALDSY